MNIVQRAIRIITSPRSEWPIAGAEPTSTGSLLTYAAILSALAQLAGFIGAQLMSGAMDGLGIGTGAMAMTSGIALTSAIVGWLVGLVLLYVMALIASALAGSFEGRRGTLQALKLVTYAGTPVWVFSLLSIIPFIGWLAALAGYGYAIYLLYVGAPHTVGVPENKAGGYTAVLAILWLILSLVVGGLIAAAVVTTVMAGQGGGAGF